MDLEPNTLYALAAIVIVLIITLTPRKTTSVSLLDRDPQRAFTAAQRAVIFRRCENRCEHSRWGVRCRAGATHADHVVPWSKGGRTSVSNAQGLCARHNLRKGAKMPSKRAIRAINTRRLKEYERTLLSEPGRVE